MELIIIVRVCAEIIGGVLRQCEVMLYRTTLAAVVVVEGHLIISRTVVEQYVVAFRAGRVIARCQVAIVADNESCPEASRLCLVGQDALNGAGDVGVSAVHLPHGLLARHLVGQMEREGVAIVVFVTNLQVEAVVVCAVARQVVVLVEHEEVLRVVLMRLHMLDGGGVPGNILRRSYHEA